MEKIWNGQRIIVTGASRGLGRALAEIFAASGAKVVAIARPSSELDYLSRGHGNIHAIAADVADKNEIYRVSAEALAVLGGLDLLVNNASYLGVTPLRPLIDSDCEDLGQVLETNVLAPFRLTKALLPALLTEGGGTVLNISSDAAIQAYPGWGSYSLSKAALDHMTRVFAAELGSEGVCFLSIDPGDMATAMHFAALPDANAAELAEPSAVARELKQFLTKNFDQAKVRWSSSEWRAV